MTTVKMSLAKSLQSHYQRLGVAVKIMVRAEINAIHEYDRLFFRTCYKANPILA